MNTCHKWQRTNLGSLPLRLGSLLCIFALAGCGQPDLDVARKFQQAESDFANADTTDQFAQVANQYDQILTDGFVSGAILYNQGNAWMRAGETGRAIACWRQAQRFRPRDPYLGSNLRSALAACGSSAPVRPDRGVGGYILFWQDWLSYPEKFLLTTVLLGLACLVGLLAATTGRRKAMRRMIVAAGIASLLVSLSAIWDWHLYSRTTHGVVIADSVEARKGNAESYETAFTRPMEEGSEFVVLEERSDWLNIQLDDLNTAWIPATSAVTY